MKKDNIITRLQDEISKYKDVNYDFLQEIEDLNKYKLNCNELQKQISKLTVEKDRQMFTKDQKFDEMEKNDKMIINDFVRRLEEKEKFVQQVQDRNDELENVHNENQ